MLRNLLSDVARPVDVRLLVWEGAPFRVFRPTKRDVQSYMEVFKRGTDRGDHRFLRPPQVRDTTRRSSSSTTASPSSAGST